jgi:hypothetical protein
MGLLRRLGPSAAATALRLLLQAVVGIPKARNGRTGDAKSRAFPSRDFPTILKFRSKLNTAVDRKHATPLMRKTMILKKDFGL